MTYEVTMTPENHGYTIRIEKRSYELDKKEQTLEKTETISTLAIIWEHKEAMAVFDKLNTFISACVTNKIFDKDLFRFRNVHGKKA